MSPPYCIPAPNSNPNPSPNPLPVPNTNDYITGLIDGIKLIKHYGGGSGKPGTTKPGQNNYKRNLERRLGDGLEVEGANILQNLGLNLGRYLNLLQGPKVLGNGNGLLAKKDEGSASDSEDLEKRILDGVKVNLNNLGQNALKNALEQSQILNGLLVTGNLNGLLA